MDNIKNNIRNSFGKSVNAYGKFAYTQKEVAKILFDETLNKLRSRQINNVLEIGCGTGFLSKRLISHFKEAKCFISDISKEMIFDSVLQAGCVPRCIRSTKDLKNVFHLVCDGEAMPFSKYFKPDLTIASMALHWFQDFEISMKRLFEMTSMLAFSIPIYGGFTAWAKAHEKLGIINKMMKFYSESNLEKILHSYNPSDVYIKIIDLIHPVTSAFEFLHHLKLIGASPNIGLYNAAELRNLCREVNKYPTGEVSNYKIAICILKR